MIDPNTKVANNPQVGHFVHHRAINLGMAIGEIALDPVEQGGIGRFALPHMGDTVIADHLHNFVIKGRVN